MNHGMIDNILPWSSYLQMITLWASLDRHRAFVDQPMSNIFWKLISFLTFFNFFSSTFSQILHNFSSSKLVRGRSSLGPDLFDLKLYPAYASSKLCEFIQTLLISQSPWHSYFVMTRSGHLSRNSLHGTNFYHFPAAKRVDLQLIDLCKKAQLWAQLPEGKLRSFPLGDCHNSQCLIQLNQCQDTFLVFRSQSVSWSVLWGLICLTLQIALHITHYVIDSNAFEVGGLSYPRALDWIEISNLPSWIVDSPALVSTAQWSLIVTLNTIGTC